MRRVHPLALRVTRPPITEPGVSHLATDRPGVESGRTREKEGDRDRVKEREKQTDRQLDRDEKGRGVRKSESERGGRT